MTEYAYYVQRWGTRDKLNSRTDEEAVKEGMAMKGATGVVKITMEQVWLKDYLSAQRKTQSASNEKQPITRLIQSQRCKSTTCSTAK